MFNKFKVNFDGLKSKAKNVTVGAVGVGTALLVPASVFAAEGSSASLSTAITADSISGVMSEITSLLPVILPTIIGFMAFRKGWAWFKSQIKGA